MRHLHKNTMRILYIVLALVLLVQPGLAAGESYFERADFHPGEAAISITIQSEGFLSKAYWDYQQYSIGYGTAYVLAEKMFPNNPKDEDGRVTITEEQALELLKSVMDERASIVNNYLNRHKITVNQNQFDALLLFTYGVGEGWMYGQNSDGTPYKLRTMLEDMHPEEWTRELVHAAFGGWVNAGGEVLPGLVKRRATEADLFLTPAGTAWGGNTENANAFKDLQTGAWYVSFVTEASKLGIMTGRGGGIFDPEGKTTRAELVKTLERKQLEAAQRAEEEQAAVSPETEPQAVAPEVPEQEEQAAAPEQKPQPVKKQTKAKQQNQKKGQNQKKQDEGKTPQVPELSALLAPYPGLPEGRLRELIAENKKQALCNTLRKQLGQEKGLALYNEIKKSAWR